MAKPNPDCTLPVLIERDVAGRRQANADVRVESRGSAAAPTRAGAPVVGAAVPILGSRARCVYDLQLHIARGVVVVHLEGQAAAEMEVGGIGAEAAIAVLQSGEQPVETAPGKGHHIAEGLCRRGGKRADKTRLQRPALEIDGADLACRSALQQGHECAAALVVIAVDAQGGGVVDVWHGRLDRPGGADVEIAGDGAVACGVAPVTLTFGAVKGFATITMPQTELYAKLHDWMEVVLRIKVLPERLGRRFPTCNADSVAVHVHGTFNRTPPTGLSRPGSAP
jgi:hypothetical protein